MIFLIFIRPMFYPEYIVWIPLIELGEHVNRRKYSF